MFKKSWEAGVDMESKKTDLKYKATEQSTKELAGLQREILKNAASYVRPGGTLIYSTCTINPAENIENVHWFLKRISGICTGSDRGQTVQHSSE